MKDCMSVLLRGVGKSLRGDPESELAILLIADLEQVGVLQNTIAVQQAAWVNTLLSGAPCSSILTRRQWQSNKIS